MYIKKHTHNHQHKMLKIDLKEKKSMKLLEYTQKKKGMKK